MPRATPEQARALRNKAVNALLKDEAGTLTAINSLQGGFLQDDLYVFVVDLDTQRYVAHGTNLRLVNTDFSKIKDPDQPEPSTTGMVPAGAGTASRLTRAWRNASRA